MIGLDIGAIFTGKFVLKDFPSRIIPWGMRWTSSNATLEIARADSLVRSERVSKIWLFSALTILLLVLVVFILLCRGCRQNCYRGTTDLFLRTCCIPVVVSPHDLVLNGPIWRGTALSVHAKLNDSTTTMMATSMTTTPMIAAKRRI